MAKTITIPTNLWDRVVQASEAAGYSEPAELVRNAIEKELAKLEAPEADDVLERRLKGLGYIE